MDFVFHKQDISAPVKPHLLKSLLLFSIIIAWIIGFYIYLYKIKIGYKVSKKIYTIIVLSGAVANSIIYAIACRYFGFEYGGSIESIGAFIIIILGLFELGMIKKDYSETEKKQTYLPVQKNYFMEYYAIMGYSFFLNILKNEFHIIDRQNILLAIFFVLFFLFPFYKYQLAIRFTESFNKRDKINFTGSVLLMIISAISIMFEKNIFL
jgi:hypothetical protein